MTERKLVLTRIFEAPRELVFKVWTDPKHLAQWWGPKGYTNPVCEVDLRPGGALFIEMVGPDGVVIPTKGIFEEVNAPDRLVFITSGFEDAEGNPRLEVHNTVTFVRLGDGSKTRVTLNAVVVKSDPSVEVSLEGMEAGWNESLDRFAEELASA